MATHAPIFYPTLRAFNIWGTDRGVGKTSVAVILGICIGTKGRGPKGAFYNIGFLKPYSHAPHTDTNKFSTPFNFLHAIDQFPKWLDAKNSPMEKAGMTRSDPTNKHVLAAMAEYADVRSDYLPSSRGLPPPGSWVFFETLGGAGSRLPSGTPQADAYSCLRVPGLLVCQGAPDCLSKTTTTLEYLRARGHDIQGAFIIKDPDKHYLETFNYFDEHEIMCATLRELPQPNEDRKKNRNELNHWYQAMARSNEVRRVMKELQKRHAARVKAREEGKELPHEVELAANVEATIVRMRKEAELAKVARASSPRASRAQPAAAASRPVAGTAPGGPFRSPIDAILPSGQEPQRGPARGGHQTASF